jgi:hypothetical protein
MIRIPIIRYGRESLIGGMLKMLETRLYMPRERIRQPTPNISIQSFTIIMLSIIESIPGNKIFQPKDLRISAYGHA